MRGKSFWRAAIYLPNIISAVALANMWIHYAYNANWGLFHNIFAALGWDSMAQFQWTSPDHLFLAMMVAYCFGAVGYYMLIYIAEIEKIPQDIFEAAKIDGANSAVTLFRITLPMIKDTIIFTTLLRAIWTFNAVDLIVSLTDGGPNRGTTTLALYIMNTFTGSYDYGYASALAVISTLIMMVVAFVYIRFGKMGQTDN